MVTIKIKDKGKGREYPSSGDAELRPRAVTKDDVVQAVKRLRGRGAVTVTPAQLIAEVLATPRTVKGTWLDQPASLELYAEATEGEQVLEAVHRLLVDQPTRSPWADAVGETYSSSQVRAMLNMNSRQALHQWVRRLKVLAVNTSDGHLLYPAWQFVDGNVVAGLHELLETLTPDVVDSWTLASWIRLPQPDLDGSSVAESLLAGRRDEALREARRAATRWSR